MTRKPRYSDACAARYADGTPVADGDIDLLPGLLHDRPVDGERMH